MNTYILTYEGFVDFEVVITGMLMKSKGRIITVGLNNELVKSATGFRVMPDKVLSEIDIEDVDLFLIPGGNPKPILGNPDLREVLKDINGKNKLIGAICAGPIHLWDAGILKDRKFTASISSQESELVDDYLFDDNIIDEDVVVDGNIITAKGNGYVEFAMEICKLTGVFKNEEDLKETYNYFKNIK